MEGYSYAIIFSEKLWEKSLVATTRLGSARQSDRDTSMYTWLELMQKALRTLAVIVGT
jgi:hypothetical protein